MLGIFSRVLDVYFFSKLNFSKKFFQEYLHYGSRSLWTFSPNPQPLGPNCLQTLLTADDTDDSVALKTQRSKALH